MFVLRRFSNHKALGWIHHANINAEFQPISTGDISRVEEEIESVTLQQILCRILRKVLARGGGYSQNAKDENLKKMLQILWIKESL